MPKNLPDILKDQITRRGPMNIGEYMSLVLSHPQHGYYMKKDPFGKGGDFTTAPEISQMFGEILGAWAAHAWMSLGRPERFSLLECGPGRGTLMGDIMRATKSVEGFHDACSVHLLEMSPVLRDKQAAVLAAYRPCWHESLASVPDDAPLIVVGNEFLDALPVRQFERTQQRWFERVVALDGDEFSLQRVASPEAEKILPPCFSQEGICEYSPAVSGFVHALCGLLNKAGGSALFIDYGHGRSAPGETLQALYKHQYCGIFEHIGDADLTAHVDFEQVGRIVAEAGLPLWGPVGQGEFLKMTGIDQRAAYLESKADKAQKRNIATALRRLTHEEEMGTLFKVIGFGNIF